MTKRGLGWMALSLAVVIMPVMFWNQWKTMKSRKSAAEMKSSILTETPAISRELSRVMTYIMMFRKRPGLTNRPVPPAPSQKFPAQAPAAPRPVSAVVPAAGAPGTPGGIYPPSTAGKEVHPLPAAAVLAPANVLRGQPSSGRVSEGAGVRGGAPILSTTSAVKPQEPVWYNAKTDRDPTLAPAEQRRVERTRYLESHPAAPASTRPARAARQAVHPVSIERRIKLTAIVMTPGNTRAIVNDQIMKVGDNVFGARIVRITNTRVFFKYKNKQFTKVMPQE